MVVKCVVFDFGGVIMNYSSLSVHLEDISNKYNINIKPIRETVNAQTLPLLSDKSLFEGEITAEELENVIPIFMKHKYNIDFPVGIKPIQNWLLGSPKLNDCMVEAIHQLRKLGYRIILLTNNFYLDKEHKLPRVPIDFSLFDEIIESAVEKCMKPNSTIYHITQTRAGVDGSEIIFLDDQPENLAYPRECLNWHTILVSQEDPLSSVKKLEEILQISLVPTEN